VVRDFAASTCGTPVERNAAPCIRKGATGKTTCSITSSTQCGGVSCPGYAFCIDAADSDGNGRVDEGDAGSCRPLPQVSVSPLALSPPFSPAVHDYAVLCSAGTNSLTIDMTAAPGGTISLSAPISTSPAEFDSVDVSLLEDQAVVVQAEDASGVGQEYWIRCLPHDFPLVSATPHPGVGTPSPGWYFFSNTFVSSGSGYFAMIVDANGTPIWYHRTSAPAVIVEPLPDTTVGVIAGFFPNPGTGTLYHLDTWTTTNISAAGIPLDVHELLSLPNGNYMMLSYPTRSGVNLTGLGTYTCTDCTVYDCAAQEVDPLGNLVWDWRAYDHVDPVNESVAPGGAGTSTSPADVFHCNSIDADDNGNVIVSFRNLDAILQISKSTQQVMWKLGGTAYNKDGAQILTIMNDPEMSIYGQHDARFRPNGGISLFDDHSFATGAARGLEYALDLNAGTAELVWQYQGTANSFATGSFRRYADGSNVIGWGYFNGTPNLVFSEVDDAGQDLLDMVFQANGNWTYRVLKVPVGTYDIEVLRTTAGLP
jgi:hypothetical protein